jgi:cation:H+ antiporter
MAMQILLFGTGLAALFVGAEWMVRGAARLARGFGVSALVVGLTVVSFGTSAPELVVSVMAGAAGRSGVALGNVLGSNIVNIGLILGLTALVCPLKVQLRLLVREVPIMIAAALVLWILALDGLYQRWEGVLLLVGFAAFLAFILRAAHQEGAEVRAQFARHHNGERPESSRRWRDVGLIAGGLVGLAVGAHLLVGSATWFGRLFGLSELVIGVTIVSIGTSLPELATSVVAAFRRESDIALGNIVGSNIFNSLSILGVATLVRPIEADPEVILFEIPVMVAFSVALLPLSWTGKRIERWEGGVLVAGYIAFTWLLLLG